MKTIATFLLLPLLLVSAGLRAQSDDLHSLSKYSYPIFVVIGKQQFTGTAFFYESNDTTYLVSNYHAIKGMNPLKKVINFKSDSLFLKYPIKNSYATKILSIDISSKATVPLMAQVC